MTNAEDRHKWYVVRAITGQEKKVKHSIAVELERDRKSDFVPEILIPTEKVYLIKNGKKAIKERNAFPGYILIHADLSDPEIMPLIKSVTGVVGFLGSKDQPVPLRPNELSRILGTADNLSENEVSDEEHFMVGESVKVVDGPFNDFDGVIEEVNEEKRKLKVMVKIFGRRTPLELNYNQIQKL
ncbi:MAG: transcription termination/antitermination factor NusG [Bacteroidota bacterium]|jgi:transcriptional antiterminator NusG|nr:transcription termination/antitermination factor NusG [Bacteroidota bacterium]NBX63667.1 transcription termination/antitermination factor NusG [Bacteroidota bacterium]